MRNIILCITAAIILLSVNYAVWSHEQLAANGRTVLLELAPVDPRSLMQGDFMALRFKLETDAIASQDTARFRDGRIVVAVDPQGIGTFRRFDNGVNAAVDEAFLRYRSNNGQPRLATNAFFFQERQGNLYQNARYGEFQVSPEGEILLTALRGPNLETLGQKVSR
jgi:uncharacterized membrane-anchored protein